MTRRALPVAVVLLLAAPALAGCGGSDNGQAAAMEACKAWTDATTGVVAVADRVGRLDHALTWATKAGDASAQWQPLADAIRTYDRLGPNPAAVTDRHRLDDAHNVINASCAAAVRGY